MCVSFSHDDSPYTRDDECQHLPQQLASAAHNAVRREGNADVASVHKRNDARRTRTVNTEFVCSLAASSANDSIDLEYFR